MQMEKPSKENTQEPKLSSEGVRFQPQTARDSAAELQSGSLPSREQYRELLKAEKATA